MFEYRSVFGFVYIKLGNFIPSTAKHHNHLFPLEIVTTERFQTHPCGDCQEHEIAKKRVRLGPQSSRPGR